MMNGYGSMYGMMGIAALFWLLVIAGAGLLLYGIVRSVGGKPSGSGKADDPLALLQIRYVRGEISREQYDEIRQDLLRDHVERP